MKIDIDNLQNEYFIFDKPVPYKLKCGKTIEILPVKVIDSLIFLSSCGILDIDKNSINDVDIIQMSYLKFLATKVLANNEAKQQMINICLLCLGFLFPYISFDNKERAFLLDLDENGEVVLSITAKEFDDIRKIILYQNFPDYDDEYINPDLKKAIQEQDELKNKNIAFPSLERKMGIISAHCGITKREQNIMTFREHSILFREVCGEVEYSAMKGISCLGKESENIQWIYSKKKNKFDDYISSVEKYNKSMGGDGSVNVVTQKSSQYNNY